MTNLFKYYLQDARRRKLDSGRVDAEAVIDELLEVRKKLFPSMMKRENTFLNIGVGLLDFNVHLHQ